MVFPTVDQAALWQVKKNPLQVTHPSQLVIGRDYMMLSECFWEQRIFTLRKIEGSGNRTRITMEIKKRSRRYGSETKIETMFLSDLGIVPYNSGRYNQWHCLVPA